MKVWIVAEYNLERNFETWVPHALYSVIIFVATYLSFSWQKDV